MLVNILATGSRGDIEPYVALGVGLARAGHTVRLTTHSDFKALVEEQGLEFWSVQGSPQEVAQSAAMRDRLAGGNFLSIMSLMAQEAERGAVWLAEAALVSSDGADLLIGGLGGMYVGAALSEKLGVPLIQAHYIPFTPTAAYPSFLAPKTPPLLRGQFNRLSYSAAGQVMWQSFRRADRKMRREVLGLPPAPFSGPRANDMPVLYGFSPAVIPPPPDWGANIHVTGYWFLDPPEGWAPVPELAEFLRAGPPPVYVGFGSMSSRDPQETADLVLRALAQAGQRGVILSGWGGLSRADLPDSVFMVKSVPFGWLFPRMAAVVHHGGAGTTSAGLRAGIPSVVIPFFADQPFWGQRVAALGVGPAPIPRKQLTAKALAGAIRQAATDPAMRRRAAELGAKIRAEDGVGRAVAVIEAALQPGS